MKKTPRSKQFHKCCWELPIKEFKQLKQYADENGMKLTGVIRVALKEFWEKRK